MFRGNSLGTKVIDMYMKMVGLDYLHYVLAPLVEEVLNDKDSCEVDPTRLGRGEDLKKNQKRLLTYSKQFFDRIRESVPKCPEYGCALATVRGFPWSPLTIARMLRWLGHGATAR